jgi:two-component system, LytTR family, response regulator
MNDLFFHKGKTKIPVTTDDILYFKADGKYTRVAMKDGREHMASKCLCCFEECMPAGIFLRVHRKYLVNTLHMREIYENNAYFIRLNNGEKIPVSFRKKPEVRRFVKMNSI